MDKLLKEKLNDIFIKYHHEKYLVKDPLVWVHTFSKAKNIEIAGLIGSCFAYGRVENIISFIEKIGTKTGKEMYNFTTQTSYSDKVNVFKDFKYRFNNSIDIALLFECAKITIKNEGSLGGLYKRLSNNDDPKNVLCKFVDIFKSPYEDILKAKKPSFEYLLPSPNMGSACKRLNMYLRWMIRKDDGIDFGLWKDSLPSNLFMPIDTHIAKFAKNLKITARKNADWKMTEEITNFFKIIEPNDPIKYDFSLCRSGMMNFRNKV